MADPPRHFLDLADLPAETLRSILADGRRMKGDVGATRRARPLEGRTLAMVFDKPSTRTRVSFDVAMRQLGGDTIVLSGADLQIGRGESIADTARVLSRYVDAIMIRVLDHATLEELAHHATVPVINGLTRRSHPCQVMADVMTFEEHRGPIAGRMVAWTGDANNVMASWVEAAARFNFKFNAATPAELPPSEELRAWAARHAPGVRFLTDPGAAVADADCIVTDAWVSMGDDDGERRHNSLMPYQVNAALLAKARGDTIFMHCLPAHRGEEVTAEVIDGRQSVVFDEAENRLHAQKGILAWCLGAGAWNDDGEHDQPPAEAKLDDRALPFQVEGLDVRGRVVTLGPSLDAILRRHDFPEPVKRLVGEAAVLAALLATSLKDVGRFILQTQTDGPVSMIVVDVRTPGQIRATASFDKAAVAVAAEAGAADPTRLLGRGTLAMTVEQGHSQQRYQGYVPLEDGSLEDAAHTYFRQSEQIPTRVRLAVAEMYDRDGDGLARQSWRAGGIIGQFLPVSEDRMRHRDLPAGDMPAGATPPEEAADDDAWIEAQALIDTVEDHELTDPAIAAERLLYRLFHERGVRVFDPTALEENCSCSREKIERVLEQLSGDELGEASASGSIEVRCEFCGTHYRFDPGRFDPEASVSARSAAVS